MRNAKLVAKGFANTFQSLGYTIEAKDIIDWLEGESEAVSKIAKDVLGSHSLSMFERAPHTATKLSKLIETIEYADEDI